MANNYLQFAIDIEIDERHIRWVEDRLNFITTDPEDWPLEVGELFFEKYKNRINHFVESGYLKSKDDLGLYGPPAYFSWGIEEDEDQHVLYIWSDADGNPDHAAIFIKEYILECAPDAVVAFAWAETCSKPRAGEFTGGAAVITAEEIKYMHLDDWMEKLIKDLMNKGKTLK